MREIAGALNERGELLGAAARGEAGEVDAVDPAGTPVWMAVETLNERIGPWADGAAQRPRFRVTMRTVGAADVGDRLRWRGRTLAVLARTDDLARGLAVLTAEVRL
ncbi:MAG: head-tail adaptor protein [Pacificimonas sp.]|jgi:hypothetical protein|nr:head-tail adaptor protein [Pacificimonas sp.]